MPHLKSIIVDNRRPFGRTRKQPAAHRILLIARDSEFRRILRVVHKQRAGHSRGCKHETNV